MRGIMGIMGVMWSDVRMSYGRYGSYRGVMWGLKGFDREGGDG